LSTKSLARLREVNTVIENRESRMFNAFASLYTEVCTSVSPEAMKWQAMAQAALAQEICNYEDNTEAVELLENLQKKVKSLKFPMNAVDVIKSLEIYSQSARDHNLLTAIRLVSGMANIVKSRLSDTDLQRAYEDIAGSPSTELVQHIINARSNVLKRSVSHDLLSDIRFEPMRKENEEADHQLIRQHSGVFVKGFDFAYKRSVCSSDSEDVLYDQIEGLKVEVLNTAINSPEEKHNEYIDRLLSIYRCLENKEQLPESLKQLRESYAEEGIDGIFDMEWTTSEYQNDEQVEALYWKTMAAFDSVASFSKVLFELKREDLDQAASIYTSVTGNNAPDPHSYFSDTEEAYTRVQSVNNLKK